MLAAGIAGCSSKGQDAPSTPTATAASPSAAATPAPPVLTSAAPEAAHVTFGGSDAGPVSAVGCATDAGLTTITIQGSQKSTIVLTDETSPMVKSVGIGEPGSDTPSLAYFEGVSPTPSRATREGSKYTVTGTGLGTDAANTATPVDMPFDIAVTCPS